MRLEVYEYLVDQGYQELIEGSYPDFYMNFEFWSLLDFAKLQLMTLIVCCSIFRENETQYMFI